MKRLEEFTRDDLAKFRKDIVLNSMFFSDYKNSFGIEEHSASLFFDSYLDFICEIADEDGFEWDYAEPGTSYYRGLHTWKEFLDKYDNIDNLEAWHGCYDDFSWVKYEEE